MLDFDCSSPRAHAASMDYTQPILMHTTEVLFAVVTTKFGLLLKLVVCDNCVSDVLYVICQVQQ